MKIKRLRARKILNSRNKPTIEVIASTSNGKFKASAPAGASRGSSEVQYFPSNSVAKAVLLVNKTLNKLLKGTSIKNINDFEELENKLKQHDQSENWKTIGGNTVIAIEYALLRALSKGEVWKFLNPDVYSLPSPLGNCIGGGAHSKKLKRPVPDFQEYLLIPQAQTFTDCVFANNHVYNKIKEELKTLNPTIKLQKTDESAWSPNLTNTEVLKFLKAITDEASDNLGFPIQIGLDIAANEFWSGKNYIYKNKEKSLSKEEQIKFIQELSSDFNLFYIEDPLQEKDFDGFSTLRKTVKSLICGDDLTASHTSLLKKAISKEAINTIIVKPNQVGSLSETIKLVELAKTKGIIPIFSHRSGETMDTMIADLAVGLEVPYIKTGIKGKERIAKLKRIKEIEKQIED